jgi:hypothetical protein
VRREVQWYALRWCYAPRGHKLRRDDEWLKVTWDYSEPPNRGLRPQASSRRQPGAACGTKKSHLLLPGNSSGNFAATVVDLQRNTGWGSAAVWAHEGDAPVFSALGGLGGPNLSR